MSEFNPCKANEACPKDKRCSYCEGVAERNAELASLREQVAEKDRVLKEALPVIANMADQIICPKDNVLSRLKQKIEQVLKETD